MDFPCVYRMSVATKKGSHSCPFDLAVWLGKD
jgi:hypothetical protein